MEMSRGLEQKAIAAIEAGLTEFTYGNHAAVYHVMKQSQAGEIKPVLAVFDLVHDAVKYVVWR
jgi:hypothetical protein